MERILTKNIRANEGPASFEAFEKTGGYQALGKALDMDPGDVVKLVSDSKLKGRGGAGFPTGFKWSTLPPVDITGRPRYLAVNFDEMEPGTFKDRFLVEGDPHQLIEGILIAAWACRVDVGYVFIRAEYFRSREVLEKAIVEARQKGYIGKSILGSGWDFELHIHTSAGRYMCGEETGLLNALEGKRANPRSKPPYPPTSGAWGKPTIINNVETLCCVPHIIEHGAEWFISLQGMREGCAFRAALPGGASTRFMGEDVLDLPLDFDTLKEHKLFLGTGTAIVLDDKTCPVAMNRNLQMFYARESCGWCTPCREGIPWMYKLLADIENGGGQPGDIDLLMDQCKFIGPNTYCAFAMGAVQPLESGIELFREDFEEHIRLGKCRYGESKVKG
jgi:NADH-quinone oxidoreductase subunit F